MNIIALTCANTIRTSAHKQFCLFYEVGLSVCVWRGAIYGLANKVLEERNLKDVLERIQGVLFQEAMLHVNPLSSGTHSPDVWERWSCRAGWGLTLRPWESHFFSVLILGLAHKKVHVTSWQTEKKKKFKMQKSVVGEVGAHPYGVALCSILMMMFSNLSHGNPVESMREV